MARISPSRDVEVLVAGAGPMAEEHVRALLAAGVPASRIVVAGRGRERVEAVAARYDVAAAWGGAESVASPPPVAVVAVDEQASASVARALLGRGASRILVEKPGALASGELAGLAAEAEKRGAEIFVAFNRRFYPSVTRARELVEADGGPLAASFEFTEVEALVLRDAQRRSLPARTLGRWGIANSLHVIDLAFFLAGPPVELESRQAGTLRWHPTGAVFAGSGTTTRGALFSYWATWSGAGRWGVEVTTAERKLVLRPLEELQQQLRGTFALERVTVDGDGSKPGLVPQAQAFLAAADGSPADPRLCTVHEAAERVATAERIFGYA